MRRLRYIILTIGCALLVARNAAGQQELSLDSALSMALHNSRALRTAELYAEAATELHKSILGRFFPQIHASGGYLRTNRDLMPLGRDLFSPVIPSGAIDPETGELNLKKLSPILPDKRINPDYDPALAAETFEMIPGTPIPRVDADGNPIFKQYSYIPADRVRLKEHNFMQIGVNAVQPVWLGGRLFAMNSLTAQGAAMAEATRETKEQELLYDTEAAYWRVVSLREKRAVVSEYIGMLERLKIDLDNLAAEGIITRGDVLKATVKLNELELKRIKAENGYRLAMMDLCQRIGLPTGTMLELSDSLTLDQYIIPEEAYADSAHAHRPELRALGLGVQMAKTHERLMLARFMPNIAVFASYNLMNPNPYNGFKCEFGGDWQAGVMVHIPILTWGDRIHTQRMARRLTEAAQETLAETQERVGLEVQQAQFKVAEAAQQVTTAHELVEKAEENLKVSKDCLEAGTIRMSEFLDSQAQWQDAKSALLDARMELALQVLNFRRVTGDPLRPAEK